jgi:hypothetical protein
MIHLKKVTKFPLLVEGWGGPYFIRPTLHINCRGTSEELAMLKQKASRQDAINNIC